MTLLGLDLAGPCGAQTDNDRNFARGLSPQQAFQDFGTDRINLLNGNLTLSIPIGLELEHDGPLSLRLALHYNSKIWAADRKSMYGDPEGRVAFLEGRSPVGLGWTLHLGRVYYQDFDEDGVGDPGDELYFETPDGNRHRLLPRGDGSGDYESQDNTWLRAAPIGDGAGGIAAWTVRLPSGIEYRLGYHVPFEGDDPYTTPGSLCHNDPQGFHDCFRGYYTTRIEDPFGNRILVQYQDPPLHHCLDRVTLQGVGGTVDRIIRFQAEDHFGLLPIPGGFLTRIVAPAFDPQDSGTAEAVYDLHYVLADITYPLGDSFLAGHFVCPESNAYQGVLLLAGLDLPEGLALTFGYGNGHGELTAIQYPGGSAVRCVYGTYPFSANYTQPKYTSVPAGEPHLAETRGVVERVLDVPEAGVPDRHWFYHRDGQYPGHYTSVPAYVELVAPHPDPSVSDPVTTHVDYGFASVTPGGAWQEACDDGQPIFEESRDEQGTVLKTVATAYEADADSGSWGGAWVWFNTRAWRTVTSWPAVAGPPVQVLEVKRDYRGFGHYGEVEVREGLALLRRELGEWETGEDEPGNPFFDNWLVDLRRSRRVYGDEGEESLCAWSEYDHDPSSGALLWERRYRDAGDPGQRTEIGFAYDGDGNLSEEVLSGGGRTYVIEHEYAHGCPARKRFQGVGWYSEDRDIHRATGLPLRSRDPSGVKVEYDYDGLGRLVLAVPRDPFQPDLQLYRTSLVYQDTPPVQAEVRRVIPESGATYAARHFDYDSQGQAVGEWSSLPGGEVSRRRREFGPTGRLVLESVPGQGAPGTAVSEIGYDALGRPSWARSPDTPAGRRTEFQYDGLATTAVTPIDASRQTEVRTLRDGLGRVTRVEERHRDSGGSDLGRLVTACTRDGEGRLLAVAQWSEDAQGAETDRVQSRQFRYDLEGHPIQANEPETGLVSFAGYDPLGQPGRRIDAGGNVLRLDYDAAGRLAWEVYQPAGHSSDPVARYEYDQDHAGASACHGKLTTVTEYRYYAGEDGGESWQEKYHYAGKCGSLSQVEATANLGEGERWSWRILCNFDRNGDLRNINYPSPLFGSDGYDPLALTLARDAGYVTRILGSEIGVLVEGVGYHPTGRPGRIDYPSGTSLVEAADCLWRPQRITVQRGLNDLLYDSGIYAYDGLNRITARGGDLFAYDSLSRLTRASVEGKEPGLDYTFRYSYDLAGNMTARLLEGDPIAGFPAFAGFDHHGGLGGTVNHRITGQEGFLYDERGNLREFLAPGQGRPYHIEYDGRDRPAGLGPDEEDHRWQYHYDHRGRRVMKCDLAGRRRTFYLRDPFTGQVLSEFAGAAERAPVWKRHNVYLGSRVVYSEGRHAVQHPLPPEGRREGEEPVPGDGAAICGPALPLEGRRGAEEADPRGEATPGGQVPLLDRRFYHHDHLGSPVVVVDLAGRVVATHKLAPFGIELPEVVQEPGESSHRFTGHERDPESGLDYMFGRYYSPHLCRFLGADFRTPADPPPATSSRYAYCRNNPLVRVDPDGLTDIHIDIQRQTETTKSTTGSFQVRGTDVSGFTLELPDRGNCPFFSRIPAGEYPGRISQNSLDLSRNRILLDDVPGRSGIAIHPGNIPEDTAGCILVGERAGKDRLYQSQQAMDQLLLHVARVVLSDAEAGLRTNLFIEIADPPGRQEDEPGSRRDVAPHPQDSDSGPAEGEEEEEASES